MKKYLSIVLFGIAAISLTGCYTQIATKDDDSKDYYEQEQPIVIDNPVPICTLYCPLPMPAPIPPNDPPSDPQPYIPLYKFRTPEPQQIENENERHPIRNTGGRNEGGRRSRR